MYNSVFNLKYYKILIVPLFFIISNILFSLNSFSETFKNNASFFINDKYVIISDISEIKCDYNFLEIEYHDEYKKFNIHISDKNSSLSFMIVNNTILTTDFIKWYMDKYYNYKINNNYKINIIDHDANSIELNEKESITLQKDAYVINKENVS